MIPYFCPFAACVRKYLLWLVAPLMCLCAYLPQARATHNRAGEITYQSSPLPGQPFRYVFTIYTYTKEVGGGSEAADRDTLEVNFGDGTTGKAPRTNGPGNNGENIGDNVKVNIYITEHAYAAPFMYVVSMTDPNRINEIINIQFGASEDVPFYIEDTLWVRDPQFFGYNNSPILYQPPIDYGNVGYPFVHNPNAFDPDGDSLVFQLIAPKSNTGSNVPLYQYPDEVQPSPENVLSVDTQTGEMLWDAPQIKGIYNIAFLISEYRNGLLIGTMVRDMQIIVNEVNNQPPVVAAIRDTCVVAGQTLQIAVSATDPNPSQTISLTAYGGPFEAAFSPAVFVSTPANSSVTGSFLWNTTCDHIYSQLYTVVFKAEDSYSSGSNPLPLADLETWQIRIVPPPPEDLQAQASGGVIVLMWNQAFPYSCRNSPKFKGFSVWRSLGCDSLLLEACQTGLAGTSYVRIAQNILENTYTDQTAQKGIRYSYRIVAEFADAFTNSNPPTPINSALSRASVNACAELPKDVPIITHVDIESTQSSNGQIYVAWSKPRANALDTLVNLPPYRYELYRTTGNTPNPSNFQLVNTWTYNAFFQANDTTYIDQISELNTEQQPYTHRIRFFANGNDELTRPDEQQASSVFLSITPSDNTLQLNWTATVPWVNYVYEVYRKNSTGTFELIASPTETTYTDIGLRNGTPYCYYIRAIGTYGVADLVSPLLNDSQEVCTAPRDTQAPCPLTIRVDNGCEEGETGNDVPLINVVQWSPPIDAICLEDIATYKIYYQVPLGTFVPIAVVDNPLQTVYQHQLENTLAGCYYITAVDSFANESLPSNTVCTENCLLYELPNAFTPNGDTDNDLFVPRKSRFVHSVSCKIFNRWGQLVFETKNPAIEWMGKDEKTGKDLPTGTYYYVCDVFEQGSSGIEILNQQLSGYIELIRNGD